MRRLLLTVMAAAGAATLLVAPANAVTPGCVPLYAPVDADDRPHWFDEDPADDIPADVDLQDVATDGTTVIAVGRRVDESTNGTTAVVYRRVGHGDWQEEQISDRPAGNTSLTQVAVTSQAAWAIGTVVDGPSFILRYDGANAWVTAATLEDARDPTAVAAFEDDVYIGDDEGFIQQFNADGTTDGKPDPVEATPAGAINALALRGSASGYAGAQWAAGVDGGPNDNLVRLFELSNGVAAPEVVQPHSENTPIDINALAAASGDLASALDSTNRVWSLQGGTWQREAANGIPAATTLHEIAATESLGVATEAIAGTDGSVGIVWTRTRSAGQQLGWSCADLGPDSLTSVAVVDRNNMWAVGEDGTARRYWPRPDPDADGVPSRSDNCPTVPNNQANNDGDAEGDACDADDDNDTVADGFDNCPLTANTDQADVDTDGIGNVCDPSDDRPAPVETTTGGTAEPQPAEPTTLTTTTTTTLGTRTIDTTVIQPLPKPDPDATRRPRTQRLLKNLTVQRRGRNALVIKFRLTRRARVAITATRGGKVVGKTGFHRLRKGRRKLILRFRGKPPSKLKVVVRPVRKRATSR